MQVQTGWNMLGREVDEFVYSYERRWEGNKMEYSRRGRSFSSDTTAPPPSVNNTSQQTSPRNQYPASPNTSGYFSPTPPPAAHHSHTPPTYPQQLPSHPTMHYAPPLAPPQVFLGFLNKGYASVPMYGPPGAKFDWIGNMWVELPDGTKDWIGPWRNGWGYEMKNPRQRAEEDCYFTVLGCTECHPDLYWR
ncbi:hypothetical protein IMSHALPRED_001941 [Imshaugia aleurites]|uniref:Uncharacterized protein n=1 Tax=Imshaugia aleurites TaxID=172621 RepID=A0A8H3EXV7_9LECA|nr:hypothetical protein IMSHALPRED_001941 [Imshaugia aleurites]